MPQDERTHSRHEPGASPRAVPLSALPPRRDGAVDLRSYAAIGDSRTVALIAHDGSIDWLPLQDLDCPPVFARLLDAEHGGFFELGPDPETAGEVSVERAYLPGTNVLQTTYTTDTGTVRVTDALTMGTTGTLPWTELARSTAGGPLVASGGVVVSDAGGPPHFQAEVRDTVPVPPVPLQPRRFLRLRVTSP